MLRAVIIIHIIIHNNINVHYYYLLSRVKQNIHAHGMRLCVESIHNHTHIHNNINRLLRQLWCGHNMAAQRRIMFKDDRWSQAFTFQIIASGDNSL